MRYFRNSQRALFKTVALLAVAGLILSACGPLSGDGLGGAGGVSPGHQKQTETAAAEQTAAAGGGGGGGGGA
ncbi:MAG: hypothetical protein EPO32_03275, partial [Anaerolineae bacterium]